MKNIISIVRKSRVTLSNCGVILPKKKSPSAVNLRNLNILNESDKTDVQGDAD